MAIVAIVLFFLSLLRNLDILLLLLFVFLLLVRARSQVDLGGLIRIRLGLLRRLHCGVAVSGQGAPAPTRPPTVDAVADATASAAAAASAAASTAAAAAAAATKAWMRGCGRSLLPLLLLLGDGGVASPRHDNSSSRALAGLQLAATERLVRR